MKNTSPSLLGALLACSLGLFSCGGAVATATSHTHDADTSSDDSGVDSGSTPTTPTDGDVEGGVCMATCATDSDCAMHCPAPAGGVLCCDVSTHSCYKSSSACGVVTTPDAGPGRDGGYP